MIEDAALSPFQIMPGPARPSTLGWAFWLCAGWIALIAILAALASVLGLPDPTQQSFGAINQGPGFHHLLGTDDLGRDILSRIIYGARVSLVVGIGSMLVGVLAGGALGIWSAFRRGKVDAVASAASTVMLAFPALIAVIAAVSFWGHSLWKITLVIGFATIPLTYRVIRAATLSSAAREYVTAAKVQGASDWRIVTKELFPNVAPTIISFFLIGVATLIVLEGALAFLGLSVQAPTPSWGSMISESRTYLSDNPWLAIFPSLVMILFLVALNMVGDALRDALDHRESKL